MPDPVAVRLNRLGLGETPKAKAKKKATHILEDQPTLKSTKKSTKKVKK